MLRLDSLDRQIVASLTEDARRSFREIGAQVGLSVHLAPEALGLSVQAFVEVFCRGRTSPVQLGRLAAAQPEVNAAWTVTGEADAVLLLHAADMPALEAALERIRQHSSVDHTRSSVVLTTLVDR